MGKRGPKPGTMKAKLAKRSTHEERVAWAAHRIIRRRNIKQFYQHRRRLHGTFFYNGDALLEEFCELASGNILACCDQRHLRMLEERKVRAIWHLEEAPTAMDLMAGRSRRPHATGPLELLKFSEPIDCAFICERVEEQLNLHRYLVSLRELIREDGLVAMVVPNAHHELIDRHFNLFTVGTLMYNMVRAGWDCREAQLRFDGRFINVMIKRHDIAPPWPSRVDEAGVFMPFDNVFQYCSSEFTPFYRAWLPDWEEWDDPTA